MGTRHTIWLERQNKKKTVKSSSTTTFQVMLDTPRKLTYTDHTVILSKVISFILLLIAGQLSRQRVSLANGKVTQGEAPWYSGHGLRLLHSRRFTWQVKEPSPGSTHTLWGKLGSQSKVLTDIDLHSVYNCENGLLSLMQFNYTHTRRAHRLIKLM